MFKSWPDGAALLVLHGAVLNVVLLLFNMLPLPMLDGGKIFARIFPRLGKMGSEFTNGLTLALLMIFFMSSQHIWRLGYYLAGSGIAAVVFLLGKVFG